MKMNEFDMILKQEDFDLMQDIGVNSYRFSISWARILPSEFCFMKTNEFNMIRHGCFCQVS